MFKKHILLLVFGISLASCIRSSGDEECLSYIKFVYDYNMAFEDLFHKQAREMNLYLFDEEGIFIGSLTDKVPAGETFPRDYMMQLPEGLEYPVRIVAWSGIDNEHLQETRSPTSRVSGMDELVVGLSEKYDFTFDSSLEGLWHGMIIKETGGNRVNDVTTISLTKNTNKVRIVLQSLEEDVEFDVDDFSFRFESVNGSYDHANYTDPRGRSWTYSPFHTENDANAGAVAELHTLRLLKDRENRLVINYDPEDENILDINLNMYINALKMSEYGSMDLQEYMDREDEYRVIVLLKPVDVGEGRRSWMAADISVNGWYIREQED